MGFWSDFWNDDKPCLIIRKITIQNDKDEDLDRRNIKYLYDLHNNNEFKKLMEENRELKKQLHMKKINAIDTDYKLLK